MLPLSREMTPSAVELGPVSPELALVDPVLRRHLLAAAEGRAAFQAGPRFDEGRNNIDVRVVWTSALSLVAAAGLGMLLLGNAWTPPLPTAPTAKQARPPTIAAHRKVQAEPAPQRSVVRAPVERVRPVEHRRFDAPQRSTVKPPVERARPVEQRHFVWVPVGGANAYEVALYRGGIRVFDARTRRTSIDIPVGRGASRPAATGLVPPGTYEWYVWPMRGTKRDRIATVASRLVLQ